MALSLHPAKAPSRELTLEGKFVKLIPLDVDKHIEELFRSSHEGRTQESNEEHWRYLSIGPFKSSEEMKSCFKGPTFTYQSDGGKIQSKFCVLDLKSNRLVGHLTYMNCVESNGVVEIGFIWYVPDMCRTYCNTESCYLLLKHAFEDLGFRRLEWKCDSANERSKGAALRLGFTFEGIFRQHSIVKGRNRDTAWFSILDCEWPDRKASLEKRLYGDQHNSTVPAAVPATPVSS